MICSKYIQKPIYPESICEEQLDGLYRRATNISQVSCSALQTEWEKNICPNISLLQNQPEFETDLKAYAKNEKWNSCQDQETFAFQFLHFDTSS